MEQMERIQEMERCLNLASAAVRELSAALDQYAEAQEAVRALDGYLGSGGWRQDMEDDEAGRLPGDLERGVLSEDGIWNVLTDCHQLDIRMLEVATEGLKHR